MFNNSSVFIAVFLLISLCTGINSQKNKKNNVEDDISKCVVPAADAVKNGRINVESYDDDEQPAPGTKLFSYVLRVKCNPGYTRMGEEFIQCITDRFNDPLPKCIGSCQSKSPELLSCGIGYNDEESQCLVTRSTLAAASTSSKPLQCGRPGGDVSYTTVANGTLATAEDAPWHAGVYKKTTKPYMQVCGGSIISANVIISAAHCFWTPLEKKLPAESFAVAVGKLYRPWDNPQDTGAQKSDIKEIRIPPRFQGSATNFQDDIAALVLVTPIMFTNTIVPVCLDFNYEFDVNQLAHGKNGRVVGWGLTSADGTASQVLNKAELPVVGIERCIAQSQPEFLESITSDKICAGYNNGTSVCRGDSGGGLAFEQFINNANRYFLRGVVSTAPTTDHLCNVYAVATFTHIFRHEHFIKEALAGNPAPEFEITTKSTQQLVAEAKERVNKENADRLNIGLQTITKINDAPNIGGIVIDDMDEPDEPGEYKPAVFIPLKEYLNKINATRAPCFYTKSNMTACKDLREKENATDNKNGIDTNVRLQTEAPITNPPPTISNDEIIPTTDKSLLNNNQGFKTEVTNRGDLNNQKGLNEKDLNEDSITQIINHNQAINQRGTNTEIDKQFSPGLSLAVLNKVGNEKEVISGEDNQRLPILGGLNQKVPNNGAINQKGNNQGVFNPLVLNQGVPNQAQLSVDGLNHAGPQGSINDKVSTIPGPVGFNLGFDLVPNQKIPSHIGINHPIQNQVAINQGPMNPELQAVPNRDYISQNIPNRGVYNSQGIHQGVLNQGPVNQAVPNQQVPNQQVLNQGVLPQVVLPQGVPNQVGLNHGVLHQTPLPELSVDNPMNLHWMANYDYQQIWHQNSPNNQQNNNKDHQFNNNDQQRWYDSPNYQQNHQNQNDSPNNQNHQNWHHSHNWHNSHDHQYDWHQNWNYQHKPQGQFEQNWQDSHQDGHWWHKSN